MMLNLKGQNLHLSPDKAIFWEEQHSLIMADLHLGKAAHFRKKGLAVPPQILEDNLTRLRELIELYSPERVLFLGDLFHSRLNKVWEVFTSFLEDHAEVDFVLVKGNHDILPAEAYENSALQIYPDTLLEPPFVFSHYPLEEEVPGYYNFYGHIHPGVTLGGRGRQSVKLPCYFFEPTRAVLPAFGAFTGLSMISPGAGDQVFVIVEGEVMEV
ncbi:ligase-associated DNA damage response endonuclease PdeM [Neolewinella aurantiaca]|uniref:Ligase-associated DNA damage response endonuclease PdeM n=1 Tax=Neolewinella aurantiaca TaxID=2602767 RepID=A0A5C7FSU4_9BACT|nr:ligase-associated DNA damage response endonuclease PdeM [Neolewinella aurantiaca]TXF91157.1 ligase-associated DNA damage response endonuclease PdeM [Neolewinella aurantiaca]